MNRDVSKRTAVLSPGGEADSGSAEVGRRIDDQSPGGKTAAPVGRAQTSALAAVTQPPREDSMRQTIDLAAIRRALAAHDAREAGDSRLLAAIREAEGARVDEDREMAA